jgi:hypothetical protein
MKLFRAPQTLIGESFTAADVLVGSSVVFMRNFEGKHHFDSPLESCMPQACHPGAAYRIGERLLREQDYPQ